MPNFSNQLPPESETKGFDLKRTPPDSPLKGLITSDDIVGCYTHWWGGRTVPCEGDSCEACHNSAPARFHCYLSLCLNGSRQHVIFECTSKAADVLVDWRNTHGTLRGTLLTAHRPKRVKNSKVELLLKHVDLTATILPKPPDVRQALCVLWKLPTTAMPTNDAEHNAPLITPDQAVLNRMRFQPGDGMPSNGKKRRVSQ